MFKRFIIGFQLIMAVGFVKAQAPQKITYQVVIRNSTNQLLVNKPIGMQISILSDSATGTVVYTETQKTTTNNNGLASLQIGGGTATLGTFNGINWSKGTYFIKAETDPTGGTSYSITTVGQFLSVPYALYAENVSSSGVNNAINAGKVSMGVIYSKSSSGGNAYGLSASGIWSTQALESNFSGYDTASNENQIVIYSKSSSGGKAYGFLQNGTWVVQALANNYSGYITATTKNQIIIYSKSSSGGLAYALLPNGTWNTQTLTNNYSGYDSAVNDNQMVIYSKSSSGGNAYGLTKEGVWVKQVLVNNFSGYTSLVLNNQIIIYSTSSSGGKAYAFTSAGTWVEQTLSNNYSGYNGVKTN